ncbi:hypothetical protein HNR01_004434 [Methylorubrum rhodesianum]|uniref:DUF2924 domain-containing protein n=1 Tax=Methylorubrum TaxID=2282523 RepID=UPI001836D829|nr:MULTISPECIES: DUF2924 domain-containing protein [Methylorubrum]MBB5764787.1 hypothetical protein [Methylorubrum rhodesianum]
MPQSSRTKNPAAPAAFVDAQERPAGRQVLGRAPLQLSELAQMSTVELRQAWRRLFPQPPPPLSRDLIVRALAYRLQEVAQGGLSKANQRHLRALAQRGRGGTTMPDTPAVPPALLLRPGTRLVREWHGRSHVVTVTEGGFELEDQRYRSLSQIAKHITGSHWSGPRFFGLTGRRVGRETSHA